jgi:hypothetical protein
MLNSTPVSEENIVSIFRVGKAEQNTGVKGGKPRI